MPAGSKRDSAAATREGAQRLPGLGLLMVLVLVGIVWTAAARLTRPIVRTSGDAAPAQLEARGAAWPELRVDVNRADAAELTLLPGIGPRLAERIVADRETNGRFEDVEDLMRVKRIGPSVIERLREYATVD